jgi:hypothetical protein
MPRAAIQAMRDVTMLMMVRHMPDDDFTFLCESLLGTATDGSGVDLRGTTTMDNHGQPLTPCDVCGQQIEANPLTDALRDHTGTEACRACINEALGLLFGPGEQARTDGVLNLAAAMIAAGRQPSAAASARHRKTTS